MSDTTKRTCDRCKIDQTPLGRGIHEIRDFHGNGLGLFCADCHPTVVELLDRVAMKFGGGYPWCSPKGTPSFHSYGELLLYIHKEKL